MNQIEGVSTVPETDYSFAMEIRVQLARIEETLKTLSAMATTLDNVKETAKEALQCADRANQRLDVIEPSKDIAEEAKRKAEEALKTLEKQADDQKWFKRTFYGALITGFAGGVFALVWAGIQITGTN
ncbi:hypothetical protein [Paenibacillus sp. Marseille-Q4541]|uniref:hypothetical protein n=1 Tax=Paenibacillus sp. Marseille-Q4541 TaxID=2831522 RepID=UPI001BA64997|nr:hypothetical protein [Paenibacillus sp. Marseille-Q4541]